MRQKRRVREKKSKKVRHAMEKFSFCRRVCCSPTLLLLLSIAECEWSGKWAKEEDEAAGIRVLFSSFSSPAIYLKKSLISISPSREREELFRDWWIWRRLCTRAPRFCVHCSLTRRRFSLRKSYKIHTRTPSTPTYIGWMDLLFFFFFLSTLEFQHTVFVRFAA